MFEFYNNMFNYYDKIKYYMNVKEQYETMFKGMIKVLDFVNNNETLK